MLRTPENVDVRSQLRYILWQRVLRINAGARWPVHWTSKVVAPERTRLGRGSYPGDMPGCYVQAINGIEIGEYCLFGPNCGLISANHDVEAGPGPERHLAAGPIRIGDRCWIGFGAVVLPGVVLGAHTVVGANAVVTRSFPEGHCVLAGNPAQVVRQLTPSSGDASGRAWPGQTEFGETGTVRPHSETAGQG